MSISVYRHYSRTIAAGETIEVRVYARYLTLLTNSSGSDPKVQIGEDPEETFPQGISVELSLEAKNFKVVRFRNPGGSAMAIEFAASAGRIFDNRVVLSGSLSTNSTPDTLTTPAAYAAGTTAPASPAVTAATTTREVILQNNGGNPIWVGDSNVDGSASRGILIAAGQTLILNTSADIYARSTGGASTLSIMINAK